ncbi:thiol-disulfide oxidoreductase DCC family protein [Alienimonas chondri]|uniref:Thiol-disulfide oxidoreductase DCC family protein n=1 Tax=Alienimonas chondri TaxID=2681879 RepID=A0ABX1VGE7_9PLAN|nr:thiol-disulfide oxidoreductase DCC family protein [Alienimonas chondri]NNJ27179.1 hypothetical protein [Alienimonas chondri]
MNPNAGLAPGVRPDDRIVLFDGVCKLCAVWSRFLIRHDTQRRFRLATVQSPEGEAILKHYGLPTDHYDTMAVIEGPRIFIKSTAFLRIMRRLPFPWPAAGVGWLLPRPVRDWLYDRLAKNRYHLFGRHDVCLMPNAEDEARFFVAEDATNPTTAPRSSYAEPLVRSEVRTK